MCIKPLYRFYRLTPLLLIAMLSVQSANAARQGMRVYDQGMKEAARLYLVICEDGTRLSVTSRFDYLMTPEETRRRSGVNKFKPSAVCAHPWNDKPVCRSSWNVDQAAAYACRQPKGQR